MVDSASNPKRTNVSLPWLWINSYRYNLLGDEHPEIPAILMWTEGVQGVDPFPFAIYDDWKSMLGKEGGTTYTSGKHTKNDGKIHHFIAG